MSFATELALFVVALVPWLPVLLPLGVLAYLGLRRRSKVVAVRPVPPPAHGPPSAAGAETAVEPPPEPPAEGRPL